MIPLDSLTTETRCELQRLAGELKIGGYTRHLFLCIGDTCCDATVGLAAWDVLKKELKNRNLSLTNTPQSVYRSKVDCLRICKHGPILVVYPEGVWYAEMTAEKIPALIENHLLNNQPIEEWIFARNSLGINTEHGKTS